MRRAGSLRNGSCFGVLVVIVAASLAGVIQTRSVLTTAYGTSDGSVDGLKLATARRLEVVLSFITEVAQVDIVCCCGMVTTSASPVEVVEAFGSDKRKSTRVGWSGCGCEDSGCGKGRGDRSVMKLGLANGLGRGRRHATGGTCCHYQAARRVYG